MSIFVERFLLGLFVAICAAIIIANPFKFDVTQKVSLVLAISFLALFAARTIERSKEVSPHEQYRPAIALTASQQVRLPTQPRPSGPEAPRARPDGGPSIGFDLLGALTSPKLSPKLRSRFLEYIELRAQLNQNRAEMDRLVAKLEAKLPGDDGSDS